jgi:hypothetical protein
MFEQLRRHVVGTIIKLSNVDQGGSWELVRVTEEPLITTLTFHLQYGWTTGERRAKLVQITVSALEDVDANASEQKSCICFPPPRDGEERPPGWSCPRHGQVI